jgi:signal peptidase I
MDTIWTALNNVHDSIHAQIGDAMYFVAIFIVVVALLAQWRLYEKAGQPGLSAFVPIWNIVVFLRIVGRPDKQWWWFFIPIWGQLWFLPKVWIEVIHCFGKRTTTDKVLVILLNGLYIMNLALSYDARYLGPKYGNPNRMRPPRKLEPRPQLA